MADRYTYVPYFGLFVMLAWGVGDLLKRFGMGTIVFAGLFAVASVALGFVAFVQTSHWRDNESIYRHTLAVTGDNYLVNLNLCAHFLAENRIDEASPFCLETVRINPEFSDSQNMLGIFHMKKGKYADAEKSFLKALEISPDFMLARLNLVAAQSILGKPEEAEANLGSLATSAGGRIPSASFIEPLNNLALGWSRAGNPEKAAENLTRLLALDPNNAPARGNLALMFLELKRYEEAQQLIESAIQLSPKEAAGYNTYGLILLAQNRKLEAKGMFEKALELKPDAPDIKANLKKAEE
jgi:tetratricopeptide (TPR) repeat protein